MPKAQILGSKSNFARASDLIAIDLSSVGTAVWKISNGPNYGELVSKGVESTDRIVCELDNGVECSLYDCGTFERYFSTQKNMTALWKSYACGVYTRIGWHRLPTQASA